jgi:hypothetical protein
MERQGQDVEQRLAALMARARAGDGQAFGEAANLVTSTLKGLQHIKQGPAVALRERLERFSAELRSVASGSVGADARASAEVQRAQLLERVLAGDVTAVDQAQPASFGRGRLTAEGTKFDGALGIVKDCALVFVEESGGKRNVRILARQGELERVGMKGLLTKQLIIRTKAGAEFSFVVDKRRSSGDELRRLEQISGLWGGLGL